MLQVLQVPDKRLREVSKPVKKIDAKILRFIADMQKLLASQKDPEGVGLAAPQLGINSRIFAINYKAVKKVFINPKIIESTNDVPRRQASQSPTTKVRRPKSDDPRILEGCLSIPNHYGPLTRTKIIKVSYQDTDGSNLTEEFSGFIAQIIQHELDHLDGILFVDRLLEQKKPLYRLEGKEWEEVEL